jgi:membrane-bound serine protease (ClpP class)
MAPFASLRLGFPPTAAVLAQAANESLWGAISGALADPNVAYILLVLGFLGFFLELSSPGTSVPGAIGAISFLLAAIGLSQLPFTWSGALLIAVAFLLFIADLFLPSLGLLTVGGLGLLVAGSYLLFDETQGVAVSQPLIWAVAVALVALFGVIGGFALTVLRRKPTTGREGLIGAVGTVRQRLDPDGLVFVYGELWQATAPGDTIAATPPIEARVPVTVTGMDGLRIFVRRATVSEVDDAGVAVVGDLRPAPSLEGGLSIADTP